jgi:hypothetical protein
MPVGYVNPQVRYEMNPPDPVTTGVILAATLQAAKQAQDFIAAISGHTGESVGTILGNIAHRRLKNAETIAEKSHFILLNLELEPKQIPLPVLYPALEAASLQEDSSMQDIWANMLANAADPRHNDAVSVVFPTILKELTSKDARFLDALYNAIETAPKTDEAINRIFREKRLRKIYIDVNGGTPEVAQEFAFSMEVLVRNRLIVMESVPRSVSLPDSRRIPGSRTLSGDVPVALDHLCRVTQLGMRLISACRPPRSDESMKWDGLNSR